MSKSTRGQTSLSRIFFIFSIFVALAPQGSAEGPPTLARDINPMPLPAAGSLPGNSTRMAAAGSQASTLSVRVMGSGTVASNPPGIDCPAECVEDYALGTVVTLTATPAPGWSFAGWSGVCRGSEFCVIDMTVDFKSVMATFRLSEGFPRR